MQSDKIAKIQVPGEQIGGKFIVLAKAETLLGYLWSVVLSLGHLPGLCAVCENSA